MAHSKCALSHFLFCKMNMFLNLYIVTKILHEVLISLDAENIVQIFLQRQLATKFSDMDIAVQQSNFFRFLCNWNFPQYMQFT